MFNVKDVEPQEQRDGFYDRSHGISHVLGKLLVGVRGV